MQTLIAFFKRILPLVVGGGTAFLASEIATTVKANGPTKVLLYSFMSLLALFIFMLVLSFIDPKGHEIREAIYGRASAIVWVWRVVTLILLASGIFIGVGNVTGELPTFPYAGSILIVGAICVGISTAKKS